MRAALFVTCLIDVLRPDIGLAVVSVLEQAGVAVDFIEEQSCCGQPNLSTGDRKGARALAARMLALFETHDYLVVPSGSCAATIKTDYPSLFADDPDLRGRFDRLAAKTYEFTDFLVAVAKFHPVAGVESDRTPDARPPAAVQRRLTYHDACSGLRYLGIREQPRRLMACLPGTELVEMGRCDRCCGFGGAFSVKYPEVSAAIADDKCEAIHASEAEGVVMGDLGCMLQIEGRLRRLGDDRTRVLHIAQVLNGER
jgi:L-lactate dehydrogenase complex protein LldE